MAADAPEKEPAAAAGDGKFWADGGPEFTPEDSPDAPEQLTADGPGGEDLEPEGWTADSVAEVLRTQGTMTQQVIGVTPMNWEHREKRLEQVSPAIARELNRHVELRALAVQTDKAIIGGYAAEYLVTNYIERVAVLRRRAREAEAQESDDTVLEAQPAAQTPAGPAGPIPPPVTLPGRRTGR